MIALADDSEILGINRAYCADDAELLSTLVPLVSFTSKQKALIEDLALEFSQAMRKGANKQRGLDSLLHKFPLSSNEGLALMHLAEALLRIPDSKSAALFLGEKLAQASWREQIDAQDPAAVKMTLATLHAFVKFSAGRGSLNHIALPFARLAINRIATQFVMGKSISAALHRTASREALGYRYSYDMLGESARTQADAERYYQRYLDAINALQHQPVGNHPITRAGISVKLSALHPRYHYLKHERMVDELVPRLRQLALAAAYANINLTIDAENSHLLDLSLDCFNRVFSDGTLAGWDGFGLAVQAYQKRAPAIIEWLINLGKQNKRRIMVRLVKGAYWDAEIKYAQIHGHAHYPVYTTKVATDIAFLGCARLMLNAPGEIYPQFATHNAHSVAAIITMAESKPFEFQRLHGMGEALYDQLIEHIPCRVYAPVGQHPDLLAYLVRRLLENGANTSFVHHITRRDSLGDLVRDPVETWQAQQTLGSALPLPRDIYGKSRRNSRGLNLADPSCKNAVMAALADFKPVYSEIAKSIGVRGSRNRVVQINPADHSHCLGYLFHDDEQAISQALARVHFATGRWAAVPVAERMAIIRKLADLLEANMLEMVALCVYEAGKTIEDSIAEVREAVDFCRYYSAQAQELNGEPLGVVLCISPWNFPLAIFIGQLSASLLAGNCVLAKAAEQTGLVAKRATELIYEAGVPSDVMRLLVCDGLLAGEALVPDSRVAAVLFTGSTSTAQWLNCVLASRTDAPVPFIAETGGQNVMIVDSTALPEQVVDDILVSAFYSAGQRCSALRILCLQEDIAEHIIDMLIGAMAQLHIGDPSFLDCDVGPVIDQRALDRLQEHVDRLESIPQKAQLRYSCELPEGIARGSYFTPRLYQIDDIGVVNEEVFGPILHVLSYPQGTEEELLEKIHRTGYGLTFGLQSRRSRWAEALAEKVKVGNVYINRSMVGAVVGTQPFGGIGLSGTGPKAGGPWYLSRLQHTEFAGQFFPGPVDLPGPTGESNQLHYRPRGVILCIPCESLQYWQRTVALMLLTGNTPMLALPDAERVVWQEVLTEAFGEEITRAIQWVSLEGENLDQAWIQLLDNTEFVAVCTARSNPRRSWLCRVLAARQGPLCPLLLMESLTAEQLLWEQTITINTAAVGGNAELLGG